MPSGVHLCFIIILWCWVQSLFMVAGASCNNTWLLLGFGSLSHFNLITFLRRALACLISLNYCSLYHAMYDIDEDSSKLAYCTLSQSASWICMEEGHTSIAFKAHPPVKVASFFSFGPHLADLSTQWVHYQMPLL